MATSTRNKVYVERGIKERGRDGKGTIGRIIYKLPSLATNLSIPREKIFEIG
jgi:hypothetical protein